PGPRRWAPTCLCEPWAWRGSRRGRDARSGRKAPYPGGADTNRLGDRRPERGGDAPQIAPEYPAQAYEEAGNPASCPRYIVVPTPSPPFFCAHDISWERAACAAPPLVTLVFSWTCLISWCPTVIGTRIANERGSERDQRRVSITVPGCYLGAYRL